MSETPCPECGDVYSNAKYAEHSLENSYPCGECYFSELLDQ